MELLVAMALMLIFLSIFGGAVLMMSRTQSKAQSTNETTSQINSAFLWLDRSVRYASAISTPGQAADGNWYVELRTTNTGTEQCTQVRLNAATQTLQRRSWTVSGGTATGIASWTQVATGLTNGSAAVGSTEPPVPFAKPSNASAAFQQLSITLVAVSGPANSLTTSRGSFTFTAINSSASASTSAICQEVNRS